MRAHLRHVLAALGVVCVGCAAILGEVETNASGGAGGSGPTCAEAGDECDSNLGCCSEICASGECVDACDYDVVCGDFQPDESDDDNCTPCAKCSCCDEFAACDDQDCTQYVACFYVCGANTTCRAGCDNNNEKGRAKLDAAIACLHANCEEVCGTGLVPCTGLNGCCTCADQLVGKAGFPCMISAPIVTALEDCMCEECGAEADGRCAVSCEEGVPPGQLCGECLSKECGAQLDLCLADEGDPAVDQMP